MAIVTLIPPIYDASKSPISQHVGQSNMVGGIIITMQITFWQG